MKIKYIYSHRKIESWPSWDIVYEWEDVFLNEGVGEIRNISKLELLLYKILNKFKLYTFWQLIESIFERKPASLYFDMLASTNYTFSCKNNIIPIIIDFYLKEDELKEFFKKHKRNKLILISSLEVYEFLTIHNCPIPIKHFPLCLSDIYKTNDVFEKKHQIILAGRENPVLKTYLERFLIQYPETEYVYRRLENGKFLYYSNKYGALGEFEDRANFIKLLRACKIAFYSTPGMDGGKERTNGFNQVTPRLFEILAAQCMPIMRYENNADTIYFELGSIAKSVDSYEEFEKQLVGLLNHISFISFGNTLEMNWTSKRINLLLQ